VHALDQAVTFDTDRVVDLEALRASLNGLCKPHIVVSEVREVDPTFDARFSCTGRTYCYRVLNRRLPDPFRRQYTWRVSRALDVDVMNEASSVLLGTHDFSSFCRRQFDTRTAVPIEKPRVRTLRSAAWTRLPDDEVHLLIEASSFCHQMVRSITGLMVDVGRGDVDASLVPDILAARNRTYVKTVAPPQGLFLAEVSY
jgi:tRNA pseudouridine38-40 synthase